jgi:hypothetical protein
VAVEAKKVMAISSIPIIVVISEVAVEVVIDMAVVDAAMSIVAVVIDMSIFADVVSRLVVVAGSIYVVMCLCIDFEEALEFFKT